MARYIVEKIVQTPEEIISKLPLTSELKQQIKQDRESISDIIEGKDKRKLLIIGPCSAWPSEAVLEYARRLKPIMLKYSNTIKIILRVYTQKPRTTLGWTGSANQPEPFKAPDLEAGIIYCRKLMLELVGMGFAVCDEAVFTHNEGYFSDMLSYIAIGARSTQDQEHRVYASMIEHPVGLKNPTSGDILTGIQSVLAAQNPHVFLLSGRQIKTKGNPHAHLVLRGGNSESNATLECLNLCSKLLIEKKVLFPSLIIDVSHDNSIDPVTGKKDPLMQPKVVEHVLRLLTEQPHLKMLVKGFMVESFLKTGNQNLEKAKSVSELDLHGLSITDSCIGFDETIKLIEIVGKN